MMPQLGLTEPWSTLIYLFFNMEIICMRADLHGYKSKQIHALRSGDGLKRGLKVLSDAQAVIV